MRGKKLLAAFLLGVGLCFVPALGHGEIGKFWLEGEVSSIHFVLLAAKVKYIMQNPTNFLNVGFSYDPDGRFSALFPEDIDTKEKIWVYVGDTRGVFYDKSRAALLAQFEKELRATYIGYTASGYGYGC